MTIKEAWEIYTNFSDTFNAKLYQIIYNFIDWFINLQISHAIITVSICLFFVSGAFFKCLRLLRLWMGDEELILENKHKN